MIRNFFSLLTLTFFSLSPAAVLIQDDFNDGVIDPAWSVSAYEGGDPGAVVTYSAVETGSVLRMSELNDPIASDSGADWAYVEYSQNLGASYSDFDLTFDFAWDQAPDDMMGITVMMINEEGQSFASAGFVDSWIVYHGGVGARVGGSSTGFGYGSTTATGSGSFQITKTGDQISFLLNDSPYFSSSIS
ncbi:MAG: hypothetical protein ACO3N7_08540 [Kiritimatiellia bacterium]